MREVASEYPGSFTAVVFGAVSFLASSALAVVYFLIVSRDGMIVSPTGTPYDIYIFIYILLVPTLTTTVIAISMGGHLLDLGEIAGKVQAATVGARIAAVSFLLWMLEGGLLWFLIEFPPPILEGSSVTMPLMILGYGLMGIVMIVVIGLGAVLGAALHSWMGEVPETPQLPGI